jgi:glycosyltransferase involved in cell wall biosynthesis
VNYTSSDIELSVVMPCLDEAGTVAICVEKATGWMRSHNVKGEVIVADNGSSDRSVEIAEKAGARVVHVKTKGYGSAIAGGVEAAYGKYVIMGDSDDSYDFGNLTPFIEKLRQGFHLVMGNRFKGEIKKGAMPFLHRYLGNPVLTFIGRLFFKSPVGDFHCGLRGFSREIISKLDLKTTGMEFASEMVVKATIFNLSIAEVPVTLSPDKRTRKPHLRTWHDAWRHLRFLLIYSPRWLFLYPGIVLIGAGLIMGYLTVQGPLGVFERIYFDTNTLLYAGAFIIVGFNAVSFGVFTRVYAVQAGFLPKKDSLTRTIEYFTLEIGISSGIVILLGGLCGTFYSLYLWDLSNYGHLDYPKILRVVIPSVVAIIIGMQTILSSFFLSVLSLHIRK